jgi:hypothetical protein
MDDHLLFFDEMILSAEDNSDELVHDQQRDQVAGTIKENFLKAQDIMKHFDDKNMVERSFELGDMVYLNLDLDRHTSLSLHRCLKLHLNIMYLLRFCQSGKLFSQDFAP